MDNAHGPRNKPSEGEQEQAFSRSGEPRPKRIPPSPESLEQNGHDELLPTDQVASQLIQLSTSRFVGDLSPESIFIEATSKSVRDSYLYRAPSDIGTWLPHSARQSENEKSKMPGSRPAIEHGVARADDDGPVSIRTLSGRLSDPNGALAAKNAVNSGTRDLLVFPPEHEYQKLHDIYLDHIHPMLPVFKHADVHECRTPKTLKHTIIGRVRDINN